MVSGSLALLYFLLGFHGGRQGSGPDRGRSPVEWGDFPSIRTFVHLSVRPSVRLSIPPIWAIQPGLRPSQQSLKPETWLAGWTSGLAGWASGLAGWASGLAGWASGLAGWAQAWLAGLRPGWLSLRPGWMAQRGEQMDGRTNVRTNVRMDGKSPHSTGLCPLSGLLPCLPP